MPSITKTLVGFPPLQALALKGTFIEQDGDNTFTGTNTFSGANTFTGGLTVTTTAMSCTASATFSGAATQINTLKIGASGTVGAFNVFPTTASKGSVRLLAADSSGDTVTTITNASQAAARTYTIPDAGTTAASFVMTEGAQTLNGAKTIPAITATALTFAAGGTIDGDTGTGTCSSNAVTISKMGGIVTTESLNTAGGASQAITITNTTVAAGDLILIGRQGGTNSNTQNYTINAVATTNTITATIYNNTAATALNGTIIFSFLVIKA